LGPRGDHRSVKNRIAKPDRTVRPDRCSTPALGEHLANISMRNAGHRRTARGAESPESVGVLCRCLPGASRLFGLDKAEVSLPLSSGRLTSHPSAARRDRARDRLALRLGGLHLGIVLEVVVLDVRAEPFDEFIDIVERHRPELAVVIL
jgi:hypothetical protein